MGHFAFAPAIGTTPRPPLFTAHFEDGNTVAHWSFDGVDTDPVGGYDQDGALNPVLYMPSFGEFADDDRMALAGGNTIGYEASAASALKIPEITVAFWICPITVDVQDSHVVGIVLGGAGVGDPNDHNIAWTFAYRSTGVISFLWQSGNKVTWEAIGPILPLNKWSHIIGTRNSTQSTGRIYVNGARRDEVTGASPFNGGSAITAVQFLSGGQAPGVNGALATVIVKTAEVNDAQALALYRSTLIG